jgi:hypothetical protein
MLLKHKLRLMAREITIVPGLHSTHISIPKLADADNNKIFKKGKATICNSYLEADVRRNERKMRDGLPMGIFSGAQETLVSSQTQIWLILNKMTKLKKWT